jgi:hypothetical protein
MQIDSVDTLAIPTAINRMIPSNYVKVHSCQVTVNGEQVTLTRFERKDGRNNGLGGEHFSVVVSKAGLLKGFTHIDLDYSSGILPSRERAQEIALNFLHESAPDLLLRMKIHWINPHDETFCVIRNGVPERITLTGMKVKVKDTGDGSWFWVIIGPNEHVVVFERDIVWVIFPGHRQTEKWLNDQWLAEYSRKKLSV